MTVTFLVKIILIKVGSPPKNENFPVCKKLNRNACISYGQMGRYSDASSLIHAWIQSGGQRVWTRPGNKKRVP